MAFYNDISDPCDFVTGFTTNPIDDFGVYAKGYTLAANRLATMLVQLPRFADYEAYPVVFLYRHAFELSLKHVIYQCASLVAMSCLGEVESRLQPSHDLAKLSQAAAASLRFLFPTDAPLRGVIASMIATADDWACLDPRSDGYRYPVDRRGERSTSRCQVANTRSLASHMARLLDEIEVIHFGLDVEADRAEEFCEAIKGLIPLPQSGSSDR